MRRCPAGPDEPRGVGAYGLRGLGLRVRPAGRRGDGGSGEGGDMTDEGKVGVFDTLRATPTTVRYLLGGVLINQLGAFVQTFLVLYLTHRNMSVQAAGLSLVAYSAGTILGTMLGSEATQRFGPRFTIVVAMAGFRAAGRGDPGAQPQRAAGAAAGRGGPGGPAGPGVPPGRLGAAQRPDAGAAPGDGLLDVPHRDEHRCRGGAADRRRADPGRLGRAVLAGRRDRAGLRGPGLRAAAPAGGARRPREGRGGAGRRAGRRRAGCR